MEYQESALSRKIQREIYGRDFEGKTPKELGRSEEKTELISLWLRNPKFILLVQGNFGIGKTTLCASLVPWALPTFQGNCRFWTEELLLSTLRDGFNIEGGGDYIKTLKHFLDYTFVVYDDLGSADNKKEDPSAWRQEVVAEMVDNRWSSGLPTIITTNLTSEKILTLYGGRVHSRLFDNRNYFIEDWESDDRRSNRV